MARFIQTDYNTKQPEHYYDFIDLRDLPLERSLAPVPFHDNLFDVYVKIAESSCRTSSIHKLTKDESAAIYLYTIEWSNRSLHHDLNKALTSGIDSVIRPWFGFLKLFIAALKKLPNVNGMIWRGVNMNIAKYLKGNDEITWWSFSSCSSSSSVIRHLLDENSNLCSIETLTGKKIRDFAYDPTQDEILLLPGTRLRVKSKKLDCSTGKHTLHLEEMSSDVSTTPTSTTGSISTIGHPSNCESRPHNSTTSSVSTANVMMNKPLADKDQSENDKVFSATTFDNGDRYEVVYINGTKQSYGVFFCSYGEIYRDRLAEVKARGKGNRTWTNGDRYKGSFKDGMMHGHGTISYANGYVYKGNWIADEPYGDGTSDWPNGNRYEGDHKKGKIEGRGTFYSNHGDKYEGDLIDGKADGRGVRTWPNGDQYNGEFKDDKKHGHGTYKYAGGGEYRGNWNNDEMHGEGFLQWPSKSWYKGLFKNGKRHGLGKLIFPNGEVQNGRWDNDKYFD